MGATHARENEQLMAEGRLLGRQVVELVRTRMPVCTKDLAIGGRELLQIILSMKSKIFYPTCWNACSQAICPTKKKLCSQQSISIKSAKLQSVQETTYENKTHFTGHCLPNSHFGRP